MIYKSRWSIDVPTRTLPSFLFDTPTAPLPQQPCFIDAERPDKYILTHDDFRLWAQRFAAGLRNAGLQHGDRIMLFSGNSIFFPVVLVGTIMAGGIFTAANPSYTAREVAFQFQNADARFLLCVDHSMEAGLAALQQLGVGKDRLFVFDAGYDTLDGNEKGRFGCKHWSALLAESNASKSFQWPEGKHILDETICLNYSSGTTGLPKGVEITHRNYVSNAVQHMHLMRLRKNFEAERSNYRWLCFGPMYHAMAQTIFCVGGPVNRIPVYVMQKFDFERMLQHIQDFRISEMHFVPPIVVAMTKSPLVKKYDLSSMTYAGSGAAPLGGEVAAEFAKLWPPGVMNLKQGHGMTETTCSCLGWDPQKYSNSFGVGEPNPNMEVRLVDPDTGKDVGPGSRGEVWTRGQNIMKGYWRNEKATRDTLTPDRWLKTGDIATVDEDGTFFIVDRMKELIKVKGNQVAPAELEAQLLEHKAIQDAAVVGVMKSGEECPRAYCVKVPGHNVDEQEVIRFMNSKVAKVKRLTGGVSFVDVISKNPSGKILRKLYREQAAKEVGDAAKRESRL